MILKKASFADNKRNVYKELEFFIMIDRYYALNLLNKEGASEKAIKHCITVSRCAVEIASKILKKNKDISIDLTLVEIGGILHDIGKSKTHTIAHGIVGGKILKKLTDDVKINLSSSDKIFVEKLAKICERHIGAGIDKDEAIELGIGRCNYIPETIEEKIIAHADNLIDEDEIVEIWKTIENFEIKLGKNHKAIKRIIELNAYISSLLE